VATNERLTDPFDGRDNFPDNYVVGGGGGKDAGRFLTVYPWASVLKGATFLRRCLNPLPFFPLSCCFPPLVLAPSSSSLENFLLRFGSRCHGGGAGVGVSLRQPWTPEERRGDGADGAVGGADRRVLEEERVPRREASRRVQETEVTKSRGVAGAGE
jgi:hypothetical protein